MVEPKLCIYKAAKEMADINKGLRASKDDMTTVSGAKLSANDRRSLARRFWNTNKEILCEIADDEVMQEHGLTDWAAASPEQNEQRQQNRTHAKVRARASGTAESFEEGGGPAGHAAVPPAVPPAGPR